MTLKMLSGSGQEREDRKPYRRIAMKPEKYMVKKILPEITAIDLILPQSILFQRENKS
jgi:hypothetical protein